jgi:PTH1 family peptidyl-tRNA hydrolase
MNGQTTLIVGLGNPERQHRNNRHNVGFMLVDALAETFMNNSGKSVGPLTRFFRIPPSNLLVIYDDLDLPHGTLRMRPEGGSAGHKGMRSIIEQLGTHDFPRLRLGIGRPPGRMDPADYVLQDFNADQQLELEAMFVKSLACVRIYILEGMQAAMNCCNSNGS